MKDGACVGKLRTVTKWECERLGTRPEWISLPRREASTRLGLKYKSWRISVWGGPAWPCPRIH